MLVHACIGQRQNATLHMPAIMKTWLGIRGDCSPRRASRHARHTRLKLRRACTVLPSATSAARAMQPSTSAGTAGRRTVGMLAEWIRMTLRQPIASAHASFASFAPARGSGVTPPGRWEGSGSEAGKPRTSIRRAIQQACVAIRLDGEQRTARRPIVAAYLSCRAVTIFCQSYRWRIGSIKDMHRFGAQHAQHAQHGSQAGLAL